MRTITTQRHTSSRHSIRRRHRITLNTRNLHQTTHRVTRQTRLCSIAISAAFSTCSGYHPSPAPNQQQPSKRHYPPHPDSPPQRQKSKHASYTAHPQQQTPEEINNRLITSSLTAMADTLRVIHRVMQHRRNNTRSTIRRAVTTRPPKRSPH